MQNVPVDHKTLTAANYSGQQHSSKDSTRINLKHTGYLLVLALPFIPFAAFLISREFGAANFWAFSGVLFYYLIIPALDFVVGKDTTNPPESALQSIDQPIFRWLTYAAVVLGVVSLIGGALLFVFWTELNAIGKLGLIASFGTLHAGLMINTAHELIHRKSKLEQRLGGFLLSLVCYPGFKIEHVRGHHVHVATPLDNSTARLNQSLYNFVPRAIYKNVTTAWQLESDLLTKRGKQPWSIHNELLRWYALVVLIAAAITLFFGAAGLVFFIAQSVVAIGVLETVNYLEHYGLQRTLQDNGRYERTSIEHSWNSNFLLSNLLTFQLQRHSDHHANPQRRYQHLRHFDESPQLPAGYSTMILLTLIPPLWKNVMNQRIKDYYQNRQR